MSRARPRVEYAPLQRLAINAEQAAELCGVSRSSWDEMTSAGLTPSPIKLRSRSVWPVAELEDWLAAGAPRRDKWLAMRDAARRQQQAGGVL